MDNETYKIPIEQPDEPETKLKITRRGKIARGIAIATGLVGVGLSATGVVAGAGAIHEANNQPVQLSGEEIVVLPGDTLWNIAEAIDPNADPRDVIGLLERANPDLDPGSIQPGDVIQIPVELIENAK